MTMTAYPNSIAKLTHSLRRYAQAFSGSPDAAARAVQNCLAMSSDIGTVSRGRIYRRLQEALADQTGEPVHASALTKLPEAERAAFLLSVLEGFCDADIGDILDVAAFEVRGLIQRAQNLFHDAEPLPSRVLIVADRTSDTRVMARTVCQLGHRVCGIASDRLTAERLARNERPDLVLAELGLGNGESARVIALGLKRSMGVPFVLVGRFRPDLLSDDLPASLVIDRPMFAEALWGVLRAALGEAGTANPCRPARPGEYHRWRRSSDASGQWPRESPEGRGTRSALRQAHPATAAPHFFAPNT